MRVLPPWNLDYSQWNLDTANEMWVLLHILLIYNLQNRKSPTNWHSKSTRKCCKSLQTSFSHPLPLLRKGLDPRLAPPTVLERSYHCACACTGEGLVLEDFTIIMSHMWEILQKATHDVTGDIYPYFLPSSRICTITVTVCLYLYH